MKQLNALADGDVIKCPACGGQWDGYVDDYVLGGVRGTDSETIEPCGYCDVPIRIVRDPDGGYYVAEDESDD